MELTIQFILTLISTMIGVVLGGVITNEIIDVRKQWEIN